MLNHANVQSASNLLNRYRGSDTNLYQRNLEAQALMAQQQALGMGIQGFSSQTALDLLQVSLYNPSSCIKSMCHCLTSELCCRSDPLGAVRVGFMSSSAPCSYLFTRRGFGNRSGGSDSTHFHLYSWLRMSYHMLCGLTPTLL